MNKYNIGDVITGKVTGIEKYGIFLSLPDGSSGLIHISEISNQFVRNVSDYASMGDFLEAKVIGFDDNNHYKLSFKSLQQNKIAKKREKIVETSKGFSTLNSMLNQWIDEQKKIIFKKNKKN